MATPYRVTAGVAEATLSVRFKEEIVNVEGQDFYLKITPEVKVGKFKIRNFDRAAFEAGIVQFLARNPKTKVKSTMKVSL